MANIIDCIVNGIKHEIEMDKWDVYYGVPPKFKTAIILLLLGLLLIFLPPIIGFFSLNPPHIQE